MQELVAKWRRKADEALLPSVKLALNTCASELERAWHDRAHDGEWHEDCQICDKERGAFDMAPGC